MKGGIAVVKHHDGFCLWPTATTEHCSDHFEYIHVNYNRRKTAGDAAVKKAEQLMIIPRI